MAQHSQQWVYHLLLVSLVAGLYCSRICRCSARGHPFFDISQLYKTDAFLNPLFPPWKVMLKTLVPQTAATCWLLFLKKEVIALHDTCLLPLAFRLPKCLCLLDSVLQAQSLVNVHKCLYEMLIGIHRNLVDCFYTLAQLCQPLIIHWTRHMVTQKKKRMLPSQAFLVWLANHRLDQLLQVCITSMYLQFYWFHVISAIPLGHVQ